MDSDKVWLLLCKPCEVRIENLPDSVINKWRNRTTSHQRHYSSRKRPSDTEINNCRLLRPRRTLTYSQDAINSISCLLDDDDFDQEDKISIDSQKTESDISVVLPKIDEDDNVLPAWKYKRKPKKLSESSNESASVNIQQLATSEQQLPSPEPLVDVGSNEADKTCNKVDKEAQIVLWRLEDLDINDPYLQKWKINNCLVEESQEDSKFSSKNEVDSSTQEAGQLKRGETSWNEEEPLDKEESPLDTEEPSLNNEALSNQEESSLNEVELSLNKEDPKRNEKAKTSKKKRYGSKLVPKSTDLKCSMCCIEFGTKEELSEHIYSHTSKDLQKTFAEAVTAQVQAASEKEDVNSANGLAEDENTDVDVEADDDQNQSDAESALVIANADTTTKVVSNSSINTITELSGPMTVCSCHSENRSRNELSVQIEMVLYCEICRILFRRSDCFETHYRYSSKCAEDRRKGRSPKLFCSTCRVVLNTLSNMRRHLEEHANVNFHGTVTFVCNICRVVFFGVGTVFCTHWFTHEKDPTFVASRYSFPKLCVSNHGVKPAGATVGEQYLFVAEYVCRICKLQFSSESELSKHAEIVCNKPLENVEKQIKSPEKPAITSPKPKEPDSLSAIMIEPPDPELAEHLKLITKWDCSYCKRSHPTWMKFEDHCVHHLQRSGYPGYLCLYPKNSLPTYICNICRAIYSSFTELIKHWASHDIIKFVCTSCNEKYTSLNLFVTHVRLSCGKSKPGCQVILNTSRFYCKICKIVFKSLEELTQHDSREHRTDDGAKNRIEETTKLSSNETELIIIAEKSPKSAESIPLNNKNAFNAVANRATVINEHNKQNVNNNQSLNSSNAVEKTINATEQRVILHTNQVTSPVSSNANLQKTTTICHVEDPPVQMLSLILDESGNIKLVTNPTDVCITTACDTTFQGSQVITNSIPLLNNSNEISGTNSGLTPSVKLIVQTSNVAPSPKTTALVNNFEVINNGQNTPSNNTSIVEQSRLITPIDKSERRVQETLIRPQEKIVNNAVVEYSNKSQSPTKLVIEDKTEARNSAKASNPIIVDSSSSDQDSEILVEKVCLTTEKRHDDSSDASSAAVAVQKADEEVKIIGTSPSKTNSKPRAFLRVKNFSELQAVKNYICQQCKAAFDNETSLNEHLAAHMNSVIGKGVNPTMRAALVLPAMETHANDTLALQTSANMMVNMAGRRILPVIPQRIQGENARKALPLVPRNSTEERVITQTIPQLVPLSHEFLCPLCSYRCNKEEELRQHLVIHCQEKIPNTHNISTVTSQPNPINSVPNKTTQNTVPLVRKSPATVTPSGGAKTKQILYNCKRCQFKTFDKKGIIMHVSAHCARVQQVPTNNQNYNQHTQPSVNYPTVNTNTNAASTLHALYTCSICMNFQTTSCEDLNQHIRNVHLRNQGPSRYVGCTQCNLYFNNEDSLRLHVTNLHQQICKNCLQRFESYNDFVNHLCCPQNAWK